MAGFEVSGLVVILDGDGAEAIDRDECDEDAIAGFWGFSPDCRCL